MGKMGQSSYILLKLQKPNWENGINFGPRYILFDEIFSKIVSFSR
jgi:hypothetical protein